MTNIMLLHESSVEESEIDSLGHMNVRFYISRVTKASKSLLSMAGLTAGQESGHIVRQVDIYSRFRKEQFAGATLHTFGGLFHSEANGAAGGLRGYFEIRNADSNAVAATFIITSQLIDAATQATLKFPGLSDMARSRYLINIPKHGLPRSLSLTKPKQIALAELEGLIGDDPSPGMMSGRWENQVHPEDCDDAGRLREDLDLMFVVHRPQPSDNASNIGPPRLRDDKGRPYSWAMIETRSVVLARPMAGDDIVSLGADIAQGDKWRQSRRWMYVKESGLLLGVSDTLGVCIDLDARRAISMPADVRQSIERHSLPQLA